MRHLSLKLLWAPALLCLSVTAQKNEWPKTIQTAAGTIIQLYTPQVLSFSGDSVIQTRSVISVQDAPDAAPAFGVVWATVAVVADPEKQTLNIEVVHIDRLRIPDDTLKTGNDVISFALATGIPRVVKTMRVADVEASLRTGVQEAALDKDTVELTPKVYFATEPTALVLIDGEPRFKKNERWGVDAVVNSKNLIVHAKDGKYYLMAGAYWYQSDSATGPYSAWIGRLPRELRKVGSDLIKAGRKDRLFSDYAVDDQRKIIVSTVPAVLVQSDGMPTAKALPYTSLFYVDNSRNSIFYDSVVKKYYVLSGGNWYRGDTLYSSSGWRLTRKVDLPADLLVVLGGFAWGGEGPVAALNAKRKDVKGKVLTDQQVPQTARVDRSATTEVDYDGPPQFVTIKGTALEYATNTCSIVFHSNSKYYVLDNGVWFAGDSPWGAWRVSDERPEGFELIPKRYRVYRAKFVYVYQTGPTYVYEGYLPGYDENAMDGCALAATSDADWSDVAWGYDLDCIFGWGLGWYNGYYRFDPLNQYYGYLAASGRNWGWRWKGSGPWMKNGRGGSDGWGEGGGGAAGGGANGGSGSGGFAGVRPKGGTPGRLLQPHPPGGWGQRTGNALPYVGAGVSAPRAAGARAGGYSGGGAHPGGYSGGSARSYPSGGGGSAVHVSSGGSGGGSVGGGHVNTGGSSGGGSGGGGGGGSHPSGGGGAGHH